MVWVNIFERRCFLSGDKLVWWGGMGYAKHNRCFERAGASYNPSNEQMFRS